MKTVVWFWHAGLAVGLVLFPLVGCSKSSANGREGAVPDDAGAGGTKGDSGATGNGGVSGSAGHADAAGNGGDADAAGNGGDAGDAGAAGNGGVSGTAGDSGTAGSGGASGAAGAGARDGDGGGAGTCSFGAASSEATASDLNLFGTPSYFNNGQPIPAGTYVITYVDGCLKYGSGQGWTVNAYAAGSDAWWLIGATTSDKLLVLPGTAGYAAGQGAFASFDDCVAASLLSPPVMFTHTGGVLGIWLQDSPYTDNTAGENDRNPAWRLDAVGPCENGGVAHNDGSAGSGGGGSAGDGGSRD